MLCVPVWRFWKGGRCADVGRHVGRFVTQLDQNETRAADWQALYPTMATGTPLHGPLPIEPFTRWPLFATLAKGTPLHTNLYSACPPPCPLNRSRAGHCTADDLGSDEHQSRAMAAGGLGCLTSMLALEGFGADDPLQVSTWRAAATSNGHHLDGASSLANTLH